MQIPNQIVFEICKVCSEGHTAEDVRSATICEATIKQLVLLTPLDVSLAKKACQAAAVCYAHLLQQLPGNTAFNKWQMIVVLLASCAPPHTSRRPRSIRQR